MVRKSGLGKGLGALIPVDQSDKVDKNSLGGLLVPVEDIIPNPWQPRQTINDNKLQELADSIKEHGIIQPLIVTYQENTGLYVLIAGERRLRAAKLANISEVPVLIREASAQESLEIALIENVQRADLTPLETAKAYRELSEGFNLSHENIAKRVGKNRVTITNTLRLLNLPETVKQALAEEKISEGHARALLGLNTSQAQTAALASILRQDLTVRKTEQLVRKLNGARNKTKIIRQPAPEIQELEVKFQSYLGTKVNLRHSKTGGSIIIYYYSDEELNNLINQIIHE